MPVGPGVNDVEHGGRRLGRYEAEHLPQDRVDHRVQPILGEGLVIVLGPPDVDVAQPGVGVPGKVGNQAVAPLRLDAGEAADIVWATNAAEMYQLLVGQRGWSPRRYEHFLADTWRRLLLADR